MQINEVLSITARHWIDGTPEEIEQIVQKIAEKNYTSGMINGDSAYK